MAKGNLCGQHAGFNLHAATRVAANDKHGRLALCKYILRPPLANDRLKILDDNVVRLVKGRGPGHIRCRLALPGPGPVWNMSDVLDHAASQIDRIQTDLAAHLRVLGHLHLGNGDTVPLQSCPGGPTVWFQLSQSIRLVGVHILVEKQFERIFGAR